MKVLLVSHGSGPYGAERVLLELARRLAARGHQVVLALPHEGPAVESAREIPGITLRVCARPRLPRTLREGVAYVAGTPADILRMRRLTREMRPDVTWVNSLYGPWAAVGARLARSPVVWHFHERMPRGPAGWLAAAVVGGTADRVVAVSDYVADTLRRFPWLRARTEVLHNPLLHEAGPPSRPPPGPFTVGYVGQLEPRKRVGDLVRALALLPAHVRCVLVGDGKGRSSVESQIRRGRLADRVVLTGYSHDVAREMERFHCLIVPSLEEAFGLAALEAMARGLPVVAARSGALPEILGGAALYHEPGDPVDLARRIERLEGDPALRAELAAEGLRRASSFGADRWIASAEAILERAADVGPGLELGSARS